jgi:hypothetical protein
MCTCHEPRRTAETCPECGSQSAEIYVSGWIDPNAPHPDWHSIIDDTCGRTCSSCGHQFAAKGAEG